MWIQDGRIESFGKGFKKRRSLTKICKNDNLSPPMTDTSEWGDFTR